MLTFYTKGRDSRIDLIKRAFVPVVLDGYLRGDEAELAFFESFRVQGNGFTYLTAAGTVLGHDSYRSLESENSVARLREILDAFAALPESERKPSLPKTTGSGDATRVPPAAPPGALVANVYFTYLEHGPDSRWRRALWHVEGQPGAEPGSGHGRNQHITHVDKIWITEEEWKALVPRQPRHGMTVALPPSLERRLLRFYAGDLARRSTRDEIRSAKLSLTVAEVTGETIALRLAGHTQTGSAFEEARPDNHDADAPPHAGADLQWLGHLTYSTEKEAFVQFEILALGEAWGGNRRQAATTNYYRGGEHRRWPIGLATELVTGNRPVDLLPPQNANPYRTGDDYFQAAP